MNVKGELINMTQAWDKENSEHPPCICEVMGLIPVRESEFSLSHAGVMLINSPFTLHSH